MEIRNYSKKTINKLKNGNLRDKMQSLVLCCLLRRVRWKAHQHLFRWINHLHDTYVPLRYPREQTQRRDFQPLHVQLAKKRKN